MKNVEVQRENICFDTLLVAIDGSNQTCRVLETAIQLATKFNSRVIVLSVYKHYSNIESSHSLMTGDSMDRLPPIDFSMRDTAHQTVKQAVQALREAGVARVSGLVKRGSVTKTIITTADKSQVDTIILGRRGLGEMEGLLLGSISHKVNSLAKCTCITVK